MGMPAFNSENLAIKLLQLGKRHQLAFGAACCERLLPNYAAFQNDTSWGDITPIRTALDAIWAYLSGDALSSAEISRMIKSCERVAPSSDDFESLYVTAAQDACFAVCSLLDYVLDGNTDKVVQAATYATDSVDLYVQETEDMAPNDPSLEQKILSHRLMQRELEKQAHDVKAIGERAFLDTEFLKELKNSWDNDGRSNLDLR
jgi:uncharacterized protein YjaG (DUF416 family)